MDTLVDVARGALSRGTVDKLAGWTHERSDQTRRTLDEALPLSVVAMAAKARRDGAAGLLRQFQSGGIPPLDARDIDRVVDDPSATQRLAGGDGLTGELFGNRLDRIVDRLSVDGGVSRGSATRLLGVATTVVAGIVGKTVASRRLDADGLGSYLGEQQRAASDQVPASLVREVIPPIVEVPLAGRRAVPEVARMATPTTVVTPRLDLRRILPWLLGALVLLAVLAWGLSRARRQQAPVAETPAEPAATAPAVPAAPVPAEPAVPQAPGETTERAATSAPAEPTAPATAPPGAPPAAAEEASDAPDLAQFLASTEAVPRTFPLATVRFKPGSEVLDGASTSALDQVAVVLNAHPSARVRIVGHTDSTGSPAFNRDLSAARAESAKQYLVAEGVSPARIDTEGRSADDPAAANVTPGGRAENRRLDLVVTER